MEDQAKKNAKQLSLIFSIVLGMLSGHISKKFTRKWRRVGIVATVFFYCLNRLATKI